MAANVHKMQLFCLSRSPLTINLAKNIPHIISLCDCGHVTVPFPFIDLPSIFKNRKGVGIKRVKLASRSQVDPRTIYPFIFNDFRHLVNDPR